MAKDSSWDVQSGVFTALCANQNLTSLLADGVNSICDHVAQGSAFPYIVLGESDNAELAGNALEHNSSINIYSKSAGMNEVKQIMSAIYETLHNKDFTIPNNRLVLCLIQNSSARVAGDGKTRLGLQSFKIITEQSDEV